MFAADFRARLLSLPQRLRRGGLGPGATLSGGESEFRGHRAWTQGDDLRRVDWSLFARLDQLQVKEFGRGEAPEVLLLLDRSGSMLDERGGKDRMSRELAAAFGYLGLLAGSEVLLCLAAEGGPVTLGRWRGPQRLEALLHCLEHLEAPQGPTHLAALQHLPACGAAGRFCVLLSDVLVPELPAAALAACGRSDEALLLLLRAAHEDSLQDGAWRFEGAEREGVLACRVDRGLREAYSVALARHEEQVRALAQAHRVQCAGASDAQCFEEIVVQCATTGGAAR